MLYELGKTFVSLLISKDYDNIILISHIIIYVQQNLEIYQNKLDNLEYNSISMKEIEIK